MKERELLADRHDEEPVRLRDGARDLREELRPGDADGDWETNLLPDGATETHGDLDAKRCAAPPVKLIDVANEQPSAGLVPQRVQQEAEPAGQPLQELLDEILNEMEIELDFAVSLDVNDEIVVQRLSGRMGSDGKGLLRTGRLPTFRLGAARRLLPTSPDRIITLGARPRRRAGWKAESTRSCSRT